MLNREGFRENILYFIAWDQFQRKRIYNLLRDGLLQIYSVINDLGGCDQPNQMLKNMNIVCSQW